MAERTLFTIGHSTRSAEELLELLRAWHVAELIDVRTVPRSRRVPWFNREALRRRLERAGIEYRHLPELGGLRKPRKDSPNAAWRNASFRGYADYMQTPEFTRGFARLRMRSRRHRVAIMCAEAVPWRCHRSMIADYAIARGIPVRHIMSRTKASRHALRDFAVISGRGQNRRVTYPASPVAFSRLPGSPHR